jgi:hypothetical protein
MDLALTEFFSMFILHVLLIRDSLNKLFRVQVRRNIRQIDARSFFTMNNPHPHTGEHAVLSFEF